MKDIVICGAGSFAQEVTCLINRINAVTPEWNFLGYIDKDNQLKGKRLKYGTILGDISYINNLDKPISMVIAIGNPKKIKLMADMVNNDMVDFPNLLDPSTIFLDKETVEMGKGNIICPGCLISYNTKIGDFNCFNDFVSIGHDTKIGNFNAFMTATRVSGLVTIGNFNYFGVNSCMIQGVKIGENTTLAAGSALMRKTKDGLTYMGVPAAAWVIKK